MNERQKIIKKFELLSNKHHKLSLLYYELSRSLNIELKKFGNSKKEIKEYLKEKLNLDFDKMIKLSSDLDNISFKDMKGGQKD